MKPDPAERGVNAAGTIGCDLKRIGAAQVDGDGGGRVDDECAGRSPDRGMNGADVELNALAIHVGLDEAHARVGFNADFTEISLREGSARIAVGGDCLADMKFRRRLSTGDYFSADLWRTLEIGNIPGWADV